MRRIWPFVIRTHESHALPEIVIGLGVLLLASVVALAASNIRVSPSYAFVGPRAFPYGIAIFLAFVGSGLILTAVTSQPNAIKPIQEKLTSGGVAPFWWVVAGFAANLVGLALLGFIFAAVLQYVLTARGFGSRRWWLDAICGLALASCAYLLFSKVLGVNIPPGPVLELLQ